MANRAVLTEINGLRQQRTLRVADYYIPLYWLCCLSPEDDLIRERDDPEDDDDELLYIEVAPRTAVERFTSRTTAIEALTDGIANIVDEARAWTDMISRISGTMRFDVTEIVAMTEGGEAELQAAVMFFDSPTVESASAVHSITCVSDALEARPRLAIREYLSGYEVPPRR